MADYYSPVEESTAKYHSRKYHPEGSEVVSLEFGDGYSYGPYLTLENSRNRYAWMEAEDDDSFVDLEEMR